MATNENWLHLYFLVDSLGESYEKAIQRRKSLVGDWDQYHYLGNCPPTPPLTQQQLIDNKLGLMLG